jgi:tetratricopeptide (TPR) repeat protein
MPVLTLASLMVIAAASVQAQNLSPRERERQVKEARELEQSGNLDLAITKLEGLYRQAPRDGVVIKTLFNLLVKAKAYERAEEIMDPYLRETSVDVKAMADFASLMLKTERKPEADRLLQEIVDMAPEEVWPYEIGLHVLTDNAVHDDALRLIARAREAGEDSSLFAVDAAAIHKGAGRYEAATREYLLAGTGEGMSDEVTSEYIFGLARQEGATERVIAALRSAGGIDAFGPIVSRALWEVHLIGGDCEQAFRELSSLVTEDRAFGRFLPAFAVKCEQAGCYDECRLAYDLAVKYFEDTSKVPQFLIQKSVCELNLGLAQDALETYAKIVADYGDSKWSSQAALARGRIYKQLDRLEEAVSEADRVISDRHAGELEYAAILFKADCLVGMDRLDEAFGVYDGVGTEWPAVFAQEAFFNLGEISFFRAGLSDAESYYNVTLRQYPDEPRANDAIDRLLLLKDAGAGEPHATQIKVFAQACLDRRQGRVDEARRRFGELAQGAGETIRIESLKNLSDIHLATGDYDRAVRTYKLVGETLDTYFSPSALEAVGDIYLGLGRMDQAVEAYEAVILKYPASVAAGEARRKIEGSRREAGDGS